MQSRDALIEIMIQFAKIDGHQVHPDQDQPGMYYFMVASGEGSDISYDTEREAWEALIEFSYDTEREI